MRWMIAAMGLCATAQAQTNLVPNGDFEFHSNLQAEDCTLSNAFPWFGPGYSPDYFNASRPPLQTGTTSPCGVPSNNRGYQHARSGVGYAGIHAFSKLQSNGREFIQIELLQPIHPTVRYEVSFFVSLADDFKYAVKSLGAFFSSVAITQVQYAIDDLNIAPQIINNSTLLSDKENWQEIRDTIVGRIDDIEGGERFLIIGNFNLDEASDTVMLETGLYDHSYYYIDDVSVIALDSVPSGVGINEVEELSFSVLPNPATEILNIKSKRSLVELRLLDMRGRTVLAENLAAKRHTINLNGIPTGIYLLEVIDREGRRATERFIKTEVP